GELITCAWTLGIAHPPGYPLYTLFGKVWTTLIPIGNIAFRMNMESALFASLAVMMVYFITLKLTSKIIPSIVASLILAFSLTFWEQAVIAEKYTLNALFATIIIFILLKWQETRSQRLLYLFSFILGLSFCHHFQTIYLVPASIFFILATLLKIKSQKSKIKMTNQKSKIIHFNKFLPQFCIFWLAPVKGRHFAFCIFLFILSLTLWLYLPLRASQEPVMNWGDPKTLDRFIEHIGVSAYKDIYFTSSLKIMFNNLKAHLLFFPDQFTMYLVWIGAIGIIFFLRRKTIFFFLVLIVLINILFSIRYTIPNIKDYYIPSFIIFAISFGYGVSNISRVFQNLPSATYFLSVFLLLPLILFKFHYLQNNRSRHYFSYDYGMNIIKPLKEKGIFLVKGDDPLFQLWYLQIVENIRKDISIVVNWHNDMATQLDWKDKREGQSLSNIVNNNIGVRPIYLYSNPEIKNTYSLIPEGRCYRIVFKEELNKLVKKISKTQPDFKIRGLYDKAIFKEDPRVKACIESYAIVYSNYGSFYSSLGLYNKAIVEFKKALKICPNSEKFRDNLKDAFQNLSATYRNLGLDYYKKGMYDEAIVKFEKALTLNPNDLLLLDNLGSLYSIKARYSKAISMFRKILEIEPNNLQVRKNLSSAYFNQRRFRDAQQECRYILQINPNDIYAKQMLDELQ
ncbi:TPA: hypothetical protein DCX16_04870, partial [bacterium]|nr:hypothetical protein [bacterium]